MADPNVVAQIINNEIALKRREVLAMEADWHLIDSIEGGTSEMQAQGEKYLPKRNMEEKVDYTRRLDNATLYPAFSETVRSMTGRVFSAPIKLGEDVPRRLADEVIPNVDKQGHNLDSFARDWFANGLSHGISFVLVDYPQVPAGATIAVEKALGVRPYWVLVRHNQIIGWRSQEVNGEYLLTQVRIMECVTVDTGMFGTREIKQIRVLEVGRFSLWRQDERNNWVWFDEGVTTLDYIPLIPFYGERAGFMTGKPPLMELAHLNRKHWKEQSDYDNLLETASVPILALSGVQKEDKVVIGAQSVLRLPAGAEGKYIEHTGKALEAGRLALQELKEDMRQAGAKLLKPPTGAAMTAEQARSEAAKELSVLGAMAQSFEDAVEAALQVTADWMNERTGGTVEVQPNLELNEAPIESMNVVAKLEVQGVVSKEGAFGEAQRRGILSEELNYATEQERIAEQPLPLGLDMFADTPKPKGEKKDTKTKKGSGTTPGVPA